MSQTQNTSLEAYLADRLSKARQNRAHLEPRWIQNYAYVECDGDLDGNKWKKNENNRAWKSKTHFDIVRQKVVSSVCLITDMIFKGGRLPFMLSPDESSIDAGTVDMQQVQAALDQCEDRLQLKFRLSGASRDLIHLIYDGATYGEYIGKWRVGTVEEKRYVQAGPGVLAKVVTESTAIIPERRDPFKIWRDMEVETIKDATYVIEEDETTVDALRKRAAQAPGIFFEHRVRRAIEKTVGRADVNSRAAAGQSSESQSPELRKVVNRTRPVIVYEYWIDVPVEDVDAFELLIAAETQREAKPEGSPAATEAAAPEADGAPDKPERMGETASILAFVCEDEIIGMAREPGEKPYFRGVWELSGRGIADNLHDIQITLNGAVRSFENNTKLIANLLLGVKRGCIVGGKIEDKIEEGGLIEIDEEVAKTIGDAVQQLVFQDITGPLLNAIKLFMEFADLSSGVPRAEQGQQAFNPQTAFELQQRLEKSGKYLAQVIRYFDEFIEWLVSIAYDWEMSDPESPVPKVPAVVVPLGFTSFENRFLRLQKLLQMLALAAQTPRLDAITNIRWLWEEIAKAQDLSVDQLIKSVEQEQAEQQAMQAESAMQQQAEQQSRAPQAVAPENPEKEEAEIIATLARAKRDEAGATKATAEAAALLKRVRDEADAAIAAFNQPMTGLQMPG